MIFLSTPWLGALAALALPIVLHLIRSGRPRRVRLGTIRLLRESPRVRARRWRPSQILLMLVRCLVLAALALVLAEPRGWPGGAGDPDRGSILVSPRILASGDEAAAPLRTRIASLEAAGHQVHLLAPGGDIWSLIHEAEARIRPRRPFFVFADGASLLRGARPTLRRDVEWSILAPTDRHDIGRPVGRSTVDRSPAMTRDAIRVTVRFAADREDDAHYLLTALEAVGDHLDLDLTVAAEVVEAETVAAETVGTEDMDLIVWLSPDPVPETVLARGRWVLSDGLDQHESCQRKIFWRDREIDLRRCSPAEAVQGEAVVWSDGAGRALLTASLLGDGIWLRFHGRFHPRWSNLVLTSAFPEGGAELLARALSLPSSGPRGGLPVAEASPEQARPRVDLARHETAIGGNSVDGDRGVELWLWVVVAGFFALERGLAASGGRAA